MPDGANDFCNPGWLDYTGLSSEDTQGFGWTVAFHPEDLVAHENKWRRAVATGEVLEYEARLRRADGEYRWFLHRGVPLRDDAGHITKWYGTSTDIEDRKQVEQVRTEQAHQAAVRADVSAAFSKPADLREILSKSLTVRRRCKDEAYRWLESWRPHQQRNLAWR